jgi:hypothetical protein
MKERVRTSADAIAHARDLLALEDEQLSARLDDVERGTSVAELDGVLALVTGALAGPNRLRALQYRKLAALQTAARLRRSELAGSEAPAAPAPPGAEPAVSSAKPALAVGATVGGRPDRPASWRSWLARFSPSAGRRH